MCAITMNWALRQELETVAQQALLYVIADSAEPNGITRYCTPGYMEKHGRMTRATMFRRLGELEGMRLLERRKFYTEQGEVRYEIALNLDIEIKLPIKRRGPKDDPDEDGPDHTSAGGEAGDETQAQGMNETPESQGETLDSGDQSLTGAQAKSQSCDYHIDDPSLPKKDSPPYPPPGGSSSKMEGEAKARRDALWERFKAGYPSIARMDQGLAREALDTLPLDDAEWAVSVLPALRKELEGPKAPPPRGAHLWLRKEMFKNFPRGKLDAPPAPDRVWIDENSEMDRALALVRGLTGALSPFVITHEGKRGYFSAAKVGPDLLAMLKFADETPTGWREVAAGSAEWTAWQRAFRAWTGRSRSSRLGADDAIRVPGPFPPSREGTIYDWPEPPAEPPPESPEDDDADQH